MSKMLSAEAPISASIGNSAIAIKFLSDLLYCKGVISSRELAEIYEAQTLSDLDNISQKVINKTI